jgi:hypothetical protein
MLCCFNISNKSSTFILMSIFSLPLYFPSVYLIVLVISY